MVTLRVGGIMPIKTMIGHPRWSRKAAAFSTSSGYLKWGVKAKLPLDDKTCERVADLFFATWNVLEDERVESFSPRLFKKHKTAMGKTKTEKDVKSSPIEALLCARFNRDELIDWHVKTFIKSSRLASKEKIYKLTELFCRSYIVPFINEDSKLYYGRDSIKKSYK